MRYPIVLKKVVSRNTKDKKSWY